jgi:DNA-binding transcriptional LysR family regulator
MKNIDWDDIRCFLAVARGGGLSRAAVVTGLSPATLGRRMLVLERQLARTLFVRRQTGYALTADGNDFLAIALAMDATSKSIDFWRGSDAAKPVIRLSAGTWTANFLCENLSFLWTPDDPFILAFHTTEARLDITHREVDIGIRSRQPDTPNLVARRTGFVAHAAFRARHAVPAARKRWLATVAEYAITPATRWVAGRAGLEIAAYASTPRTLYDLIHAGLGNGVIPCFAGDRDPMLERTGPPIADLMEEQWLVMHDEGRSIPAIRTVIDRVADLLVEHGALFSGQRPLGATATVESSENSL